MENVSDIRDYFWWKKREKKLANICFGQKKKEKKSKLRESASGRLRKTQAEDFKSRFYKMYKFELI